MAYGHAERNLTLIRQLEAETRKLLGSLNQLDPEQSAWLHEVAGPRRQAGHQYRPEPASAIGRECRNGGSVNSNRGSTPGRLRPLCQQLVS